MPRRRKAGKSDFGTVVFLNDKPRKKPWRAQFIRDAKAIRKHFENEPKAKEWLAEQRLAIRDTGRPLSNSELGNETIYDLLNNLLKHKVAKLGATWEKEDRYAKRLRALMNDKELCSKRLSKLTDFVGRQYVTRRKEEGVLASTISKELNVIKAAFYLAKEQEKYQLLQDPFQNIRLEGALNKRSRKFRPGEEEAIKEVMPMLYGTNRLYIPLAMELMLQTGMRIDEIVDVKWKAIKFEDGQIHVIRSKKDYRTGYAGRMIVIPPLLELWLMQLKSLLFEGKPRDSLGFMEGKLLRPLPKRPPVPIEQLQEEHVLLQNDGTPMTVESIENIWRKHLRKKANLQPHPVTKQTLWFRDLRREARSRFRKFLSQEEMETQMGHELRKRQNDTYDDPEEIKEENLVIIRQKMERHLFGGKVDPITKQIVGGLTYEEAEKKQNEEYREFLGECFKAGMNKEEADELYLELQRKRYEPMVRLMQQRGMIPSST
jgi:integrase